MELKGEGRVHEALMLVNKHSHHDALQLFEEIIRDNPEVHELRYGKALVLARIGRTPEALEILRDLSTRLSEHINCKALLAELERSSSEIVPAAQGIKELKSVEPQVELKPVEPEKILNQAPQEPGAQVLVKDESEADTIDANVEVANVSEEDWSKYSPDQIVDKVIEALRAGAVDLALKISMFGKRSRKPVADLEFVRALAFSKQMRWTDACTALSEELRFFPDSEEAAALFQEVRLKCENEPAAGTAKYPGDFLQILEGLIQLMPASQQSFYSLYRHAQRVCQLNIAGNFVICGAGNGVSTILLASVVSKYSKRPRLLYVIDSFCGNTEPGEFDKIGDKPAAAHGYGAGSNMASEQAILGQLKARNVAESVCIVAGEFSEVLPREVPALKPLALLYIDAWWHRDVRAILDNLYDCCSVGAVVQINNFGYWAGVEGSVREFEAARGVKFEIHRIDPRAAWFERLS